MNENLIILYKELYGMSIMLSIVVVQLVGIIVILKFIYEKFIIPVLDITVDFLIRQWRKIKK